MLYAEMVRHGYTHVAEFHYVHHDPEGKPYANLAEMGERLVSAAARTGIQLTLIPIFYQKGGFGKAPNPGQRRFISPDETSYLHLLDASEKACTHYAGARVGIGMHSMRGVEPELIARLANEGPQDLPFHIHVSEQKKEIEDSLSYLGKRPVEWLLDKIDLNPRYHLVHATHLTADETEKLAKSKANVVLCPSTEGNLGDGIFPLKAYQDFGGQWSIGTDSHIGLNPFEELRLLDYGQRLVTHQRNTFAGIHGDSGLFAFDMALRAGRKAMHNFAETYFEVGAPLHACVMDAAAPLNLETASRVRSATLLYASDASMHWGTIIQGKIWSRGTRHIAHEAIREEFAKALRTLNNRK
jgi:formimidoylglutamate deiminase